MAEILLIQVDSNTGARLGSWSGDEAKVPEPPPGVTFVPAAKYEDAKGKHWDGEKWEAAPIRTIQRGAFMDRFTMPTQMALEAIAEQQNDAGRLVRVFTRRLEAEATVFLDSPVLASALGQIRTILTTEKVAGWGTAEDADASVAAILA